MSAVRARDFGCKSWPLQETVRFNVVLVHPYYGTLLFEHNRSQLKGAAVLSDSLLSLGY